MPLKDIEHVRQEVHILSKHCPWVAPCQQVGPRTEGHALWCTTRAVWEWRNVHLHEPLRAVVINGLTISTWSTHNHTTIVQQFSYLCVETRSGRLSLWKKCEWEYMCTPTPIHMWALFCTSEAELADVLVGVFAIGVLKQNCSHCHFPTQTLHSLAVDVGSAALFQHCRLHLRQHVAVLKLVRCLHPNGSRTHPNHCRWEHLLEPPAMKRHVRCVDHLESQERGAMVGRLKRVSKCRCKSHEHVYAPVQALMGELEHPTMPIERPPECGREYKQEFIEQGLIVLQLSTPWAVNCLKLALTTPRNSVGSWSGILESRAGAPVEIESATKWSTCVSCICSYGMAATLLMGHQGIWVHKSSSHVATRRVDQDESAGLGLLRWGVPRRLGAVEKGAVANNLRVSSALAHHNFAAPWHANPPDAHHLVVGH